MIDLNFPEQRRIQSGVLCTARSGFAIGIYSDTNNMSKIVSCAVLTY